MMCWRYRGAGHSRHCIER